MRELYLQERQRSIVNLAERQIGMSSSATSETKIVFRTVDPCHVEYLTAMSVQSSLVVPILDNHRLWGLLVSHHSSPRILTKTELETIQLVAAQTSIAIAQSNLLESTRIQAMQEATINRVGRSLHSMTEMQLQQALKQTVLALQGLGGRVYLAPRKISATFPDEERFGLTNQIRRACVSIESNISEGAGRNSNKDFSRFLRQQAKLASVARTAQMRQRRFATLRR